MAFKNKHLSYSRLSRFEQCPLRFKLHYIEKKEAGCPIYADALKGKRDFICEDLTDLEAVAKKEREEDA